jgi:hypothetical protein
MPLVNRGAAKAVAAATGSGIGRGPGRAPAPVAPPPQRTFRPNPPAPVVQYRAPAPPPSRAISRGIAPQPQQRQVMMQPKMGPSLMQPPPGQRTIAQQIMASVPQRTGPAPGSQVFDRRPESLSDPFYTTPFATDQDRLIAKQQAAAQVAAATGMNPVDVMALPSAVVAQMLTGIVNRSFPQMGWDAIAARDANQLVQLGGFAQQRGYHPPDPYANIEQQREQPRTTVYPNSPAKTPEPLGGVQSMMPEAPNPTAVYPPGLQPPPGQLTIGQQLGQSRTRDAEAREQQLARDTQALAAAAQSRNQREQEQLARITQGFEEDQQRYESFIEQNHVRHAATVAPLMNAGFDQATAVRIALMLDPPYTTDDILANPQGDPTQSMPPEVLPDIRDVRYLQALGMSLETAVQMAVQAQTGSMGDGTGGQSEVMQSLPSIVDPGTDLEDRILRAGQFTSESIGGAFADMFFKGDVFSTSENTDDMIRDAGHEVGDRVIPFLEDHPGLASALAKLDWGRGKVIEDIGDDVYRMLDEGVDWQDMLPVGPEGFTHPYGIMLAIYLNENPEMEALARQYYEEGYSSPEYLRALQEGISQSGGQGQAYDIDPEWIGGRAIWEGIVASQGDDLPLPIRAGYALLTDIVTDPLSLAGPVGRAGRALARVGVGVRAIRPGVVGQAAGRVINLTGRGIDTAAHIADSPLSIAGMILKKVDPLTGLLRPGRAGQLDTALANTADAAESMRAAAAATGVGGQGGPRGYTPPGGGAAPPGGAPGGAPPIVTPPYRNPRAPRRRGPKGPPPSAAAPGVGMTPAPPPRTGGYIWIHVNGVRTLVPAPASWPGPTVPGPNVSGPGRTVVPGASPAVTPSSGGVTPATGPHVIPINGVMTFVPGRATPSTPSGPGRTAVPGAAPAVTPSSGGVTPATGPMMTPGVSVVVPSTSSAPSPTRGAAQITPAEPDLDYTPAGAAPPLVGQVDNATDGITVAKTSIVDELPPDKTRIVDGATGEQTVVPTSIVDQPRTRLSRIIERTEATVDQRLAQVNRADVPAENLLSPVVGGGRLIDYPMDRVIMTGDPEVIQRAESFYRQVEPQVGIQLQGDNFHARADGSTVNPLTQGGRPISEGGTAAMNRAFPGYGGSQSNVARLVHSQVLQQTSLLGAEARLVASHLRAHGFSLDLPYSSPRISPNGNYVGESFGYLAERFVKTASDADAQTIMDDFLKASDGFDIVEGPDGMPYVVGMPNAYKSEILRRLQQAREDFQAIRNADPDAIRELVNEGAIRGIPAPDAARQFNSGNLSADSKQFAKKIEALVADLKTRQTGMVAKNARDSGVTPAMTRSWAEALYGESNLSKLTPEQLNDLNSRTLHQVKVRLQFRRKAKGKGRGAQVEIREEPDGAWVAWEKMGSQTAAWKRRGDLQEYIEEVEADPTITEASFRVLDGNEDWDAPAVVEHGEAEEALHDFDAPLDPESIIDAQDFAAQFERDNPPGTFSDDDVYYEMQRIRERRQGADPIEVRGRVVDDADDLSGVSDDEVLAEAQDFAARFDQEQASSGGLLPRAPDAPASREDIIAHLDHLFGERRSDSELYAYWESLPEPRMDYYDFHQLSNDYKEVARAEMGGDYGDLFSQLQDDLIDKVIRIGVADGVLGSAKHLGPRPGEPGWSLFDEPSARGDDAVLSPTEVLETHGRVVGDAPTAASAQDEVLARAEWTDKTDKTPVHLELRTEPTGRVTAYRRAVDGDWKVFKSFGKNREGALRFMANQRAANKGRWLEPNQEFTPRQPTGEVGQKVVPGDGTNSGALNRKDRYGQTFLDDPDAKQIANNPETQVQENPDATREYMDTAEGGRYDSFYYEPDNRPPDTRTDAQIERDMLDPTKYDQHTGEWIRPQDRPAPIGTLDAEPNRQAGVETRGPQNVTAGAAQPSPQAATARLQRLDAMQKQSKDGAELLQRYAADRKITGKGTADLLKLFKDEVAMLKRAATNSQQLGFVANDPLSRLVLSGFGASKVRGWYRSIIEAGIEAADTTADIGLKNPDVRYLWQGAWLTNEQALLLDRVIDWTPPGVPAGGAPWTVFEALSYIDNRMEDALNTAQSSSRYGPDVESQIRRVYRDDFVRITNLAHGLDEAAPMSKKAKKLLDLYDTAMNLNRQMRLFNAGTGVAGFVGDVAGNAWAAVVHGDFHTAFAAFNPVRMRRTALGMLKKDARGEYTSAQQMMATLASDFHRETGMVMPPELAPAEFREVRTSGLPSPNQWVENRSFVTRQAAKLATVPIIKAGRTATDLIVRQSSYDRVFRHQVKNQGLPAFYKALVDIAGDRATADAWMARIKGEAFHKSGGEWSGMFSPQDVINSLKGVTKRNNDLGRAWQSELVKAQKAGMAQSHKMYFSYKNTNIDEGLKRIFTFHYWQSRATYMHFRAALRNPVLLNMYYKIWEEVKQEAEENHYPPGLKDVIEFMAGPHGIYGAFSPLGIIIPMTIIDMESAEGTDWAVLRNQLSPFISAALGVMGMSDFTPSITGTRSMEQWVQNLANYLETRGVVPESIPLLGQLLNDGKMMTEGAWSNQMTEFFIGYWNDKLQDIGVINSDFQPFDRASNEADQLSSWVQQVAVERWGERDTWTDAELAEYDAALDAVLAGSNDNDLAQEAQERWASEGMYQNIFSFIPGGNVFRSGFRDETMHDSSTGMKKNPRDRNQTEINAIQLRQEATAADPTWRITNDQYYQIGTEEQQDIHDTYWQIIYNPDWAWQRSFSYYNEEYGEWATMSGHALSGMTEQQRKDFADNWLAQRPGGEEAVRVVREGRDAFKAEHPEYADWLTYQKGLYQLEEQGRLTDFRVQLAKDNPNFHAAMDKEEERLKDEGVSGQLLVTELDNWMISQSAYHAVIGEPWKRGDEVLPVNDLEGNPMLNPNFSGLMDGSLTEDPAEEEGGGGGFQSFAERTAETGGYQAYDWRPRGPAFSRGRKFAEYPEGSYGHLLPMIQGDIRQWEEDNATAERVYGDAWDSNAGTWEPWAADTDAYYTSAYPTSTPMMKEYEHWLQRQPYGADTSVQAFIQWLVESGYAPPQDDPYAASGIGR